jgi:hypothetical protein
MAKATGPRTLAGKEISKRNSLKHGIFSKVALLQNESRPEFDSLLSGLRNDFQSKGTLEEILVEKLATLFWRYRRLMIAETAEIQKETAFLEWENAEQQDMDTMETSHVDPQDSDSEVVPLIRKIANPEISEVCLKILNELKNEFESHGFNSESNRELLTKLYGTRDWLTENLFDAYIKWRDTAECSEEEREQNGYASVQECKSSFLSELEEEITWLDRYKKGKASINAERIELESLRRSVPDGPQLDRLLKYEASINREIDRTLTQLERLQRMRLGQPVSSPIKLDISS